jgi:hypothetical protein
MTRRWENVEKAITVRRRGTEEMGMVVFDAFRVAKTDEIMVEIDGEGHISRAFDADLWEVVKTTKFEIDSRCSGCIWELRGACKRNSPVRYAILTEGSSINGNNIPKRIYPQCKSSKAAT